MTSLRRAATLLALSAALTSHSHAQNTVNLSGLQLQPIKIANLDLNVLRVAPATFQQTLQAPNVLQLNLQDLPARIQARDAELTRGLNVTRALSASSDVRADAARVALALPRGLTVPATVRLRTGEQKEVQLFGQDTVALNVAQAEASAPQNRAAVLKSFGLNEQNPVPREFLSADTRNTVSVAALIKTPIIVNLAGKAPTPSQPGQELGDGFVSNPSDGACRFTPTNAMFGQMKGTNIGLITTIKDQGARGTCMAFAYVSALESLIARRTTTRYNLSEQYAYYWMRGDDGTLGDGAWWGDYDDMIAKKRMIPTEVRWKYNASRSRLRVPADTKQPITAYKNSCVNYLNQACSDTTVQAQLVCQNGTNNCAWKPEWDIAPNAAFNFRPTAGNEVWVALGGLNLGNPAATRAYRRAMLRQMLDRGDQLVLGFGVDRAFDAIGANGLPNTALMGQNFRGGHGVHMVGYVNTGTQTYDVKIGGLVGAKMTLPTGYFVIKNSWSCGFGDGGYAYLPDNFMDQETWGVYNMPNNAVASDLAGF
ncbi:C1 family peptidase [Deinococcus aquaedulcis]|uniref:C1 family peptidase n=1 Tax=Deinococcus aquaedulcis TaxID=2840455 RepID=UPI001C838D04|nr:C1 family peptidase [Deinococcus aquaedulcis]